ncbi:MAG: FmdB family zinc ribbon protein [Bdellovibrionia bacterium]
MALFEYRCDRCQLTFEQIGKAGDPELGQCPQCQGRNTQKLISFFAVGGRGDLRESTLHGCHGCHSGHSHGSLGSSSTGSSDSSASTPSE